MPFELLFVLLAFRALLLLLPEEVLPDTCVWPEPLDIVPEVPVEESEVPSDIEPDEPEPEVPVDEPEPEVPEPEPEVPEPVEEPEPIVPPVVPCGCVEVPEPLPPCVPWPIWDEEPLDWVSVEEPDDMEPEELEPDVPLRGVVVLGEEVWACAAVATPAASKVAKNKVVFIDVRSKG